MGDDVGIGKELAVGRTGRVNAGDDRPGVCRIDRPLEGNELLELREAHTNGVA